MQVFMLELTIIVTLLDVYVANTTLEICWTSMQTCMRKKMFMFNDEKNLMG